MPSDAITVQRFYDAQHIALELNLVTGDSGLKRIIREPTVNRPGLVLAGFTRYFANKRAQVIGNAEAFFLKSMPPEDQAKRYENFFSYKVPCVVFCRNSQPNKLCLKAAEQACRSTSEPDACCTRHCSAPLTVLGSASGPRLTVK